MTRKATILIVEDKRDFADLFSSWLEADYNTRIVTSGEEAIAALDENFDLVLLDRRMPNVSGDEVLDEVQRGSLDIPVVIISAVEPDFDIVEMNVDNYLVKPITREELNVAVEEALSRHDLDTRESDVVPQYHSTDVYIDTKFS